MSEGSNAALVTGGSRGIGYELAALLAADGHDLVLVARSEADLRAAADEFEERHGIDAAVVPADLTDPGAAREVYETVQEAGIVVDTLVNNAGYGVYGEFVETDLDAELEVIGLHVVTVTVLTKLFVRDMVDRGDGRVLNNASIAGWAPLPTSAVYSAAKHYERALSEALAEEVADDGVTVTALCPGETDTGFMDRGNFGTTAHDEDDLMDPETVARAGYEGLNDGDRIVIPGLKSKLSVFLGRVLPRTAYVRAAERAQNE